ncbi:MAG: 30S ribosomal protein S6 [Leptospirillum sp.]|jgi:small subunit ribosomal protein S6
MSAFYECVLLLKSQLTDEESALTVSRFTNLIESKSGVVHHIQKMGRKRMAYELNKEKRAEYVILYLELQNPSDISELDRQARIDERVVKSMIVRKEKLNFPKSDSSQEESLSDQDDSAILEGDAR